MNRRITKSRGKGLKKKEYITMFNLVLLKRTNNSNQSVTP